MADEAGMELESSGTERLHERDEVLRDATASEERLGDFTL
jgi:hypothetical protein